MSARLLAEIPYPEATMRWDYGIWLGSWRGDEILVSLSGCGTYECYGPLTNETFYKISLNGKYQESKEDPRKYKNYIYDMDGSETEQNPHYEYEYPKDIEGTVITKIVVTNQGVPKGYFTIEGKKLVAHPND
jgi:hypothetical protein